MTEAEENAAVAEIARRLEAEGLAAEEMAPELPPAATVAGKLAELEIEETIRTGNSPEFRGARDWIPEAAAPVLPLSDLRERIAILTAAGVTRYRDAGVELQFDPEAQKKDGRTEPKTERF
jgi:hypothetical protein